MLSVSSSEHCSNNILDAVDLNIVEELETVVNKMADNTECGPARTGKRKLVLRCDKLAHLGRTKSTAVG